jgi:hypothetical protein
MAFAMKTEGIRLTTLVHEQKQLQSKRYGQDLNDLFATVNVI